MILRQLEDIRQITQQRFELHISDKTVICALVDASLIAEFRLYSILAVEVENGVFEPASQVVDDENDGFSDILQKAEDNDVIELEEDVGDLGDDYDF